MARERKKDDTPLLERDGMISKQELSDFLGIPLGTLDQWASRGNGPDFHVIGNHRKYAPADVKSWLATQKHKTSSDRKGRQSRTNVPEAGAA